MKQFIKNILDTNVDHRRETITYTVNALYDDPHDDGNGHVYYDVKTVKVKEITYTWDEIDKIGQWKILDELKEKYNIN